MKHINITNWQGNITDWTKFNYIYGGLDETIADKVNLSIPGTNLRNYFGKSNNLIPLPNMPQGEFYGLNYKVENGVITVSGTSTNAVNLWLNIGTVLPENTRYYINFFYQGTAGGRIIYNIAKRRNDWTNRVYTETSQFTFIRNYSMSAICLQFEANKEYNCTFKPMVVYGNVMPTIFEPYGSTVMVEKVGKVDLGSLTYERTKWGQNYVFQTSLNDMAKTPANNVNLSCPNYSTVSESYLYGNVTDKVIANNTNASMNLKIVDNAYTDVNAFKSAMNGIYLTYELAEPKVTVFNQVDLGSLTWEYQSGNTRFRTTLSDYKKTTRQSTPITASCPMYKIVTWIDNYSQDDMCLCGYSTEYGPDQYIYIRNLNYTDATTFKSAMNGVYLIYELASKPSANMLGMVKPSDPAPTAIEDSMSLDELLEPANEER